MTDAVADGEPHTSEVELKYAVQNSDSIREWLEKGLPPGISAGRWTTRSDEDSYVDTADRALGAAGFGARLRRRGYGITLTLKSLGSVGARPGDGTGGPTVSDALHRRVEIEGPATRSLEPGSWPESEARDLLESITHGAPLKLRFVIQQRRAVRKLRSDDGTAELSLDDVKVKSRNRIVGTFTTLEIESLSGSLALLDRLAAALESTGLVEAESRSKEAIGAALVEGRAAASRGRPAQAGIRASGPLRGLWPTRQSPLAPGSNR